MKKRIKELKKESEKVKKKQKWESRQVGALAAKKVVMITHFP